MELSRAAFAFRAGHTAIAIEQLLAIAYVCWCALTGRCDSLLRIAVATLLIESVLVVANRGDCPWGGLQQRLGDPVPLFELVRRTVGRADTGRHHHRWACPVGGMRSPRQALART
jgi:hypothetical protein